MWRRRWDSNPRTSFPVTPLAGERLRPLGHVSTYAYSRANPRFTRRNFKKTGPGSNSPKTLKWHEKARNGTSFGQDLVNSPYGKSAFYTVKRKVSATRAQPSQKFATTFSGSGRANQSPSRKEVSA